MRETKHQRISTRKSEYPEKALEIAKKSRLKKAFNLSVDEYQKMVEAQGNVCAICHSNHGKKRLSVDHDHVTGNVRALLCDKCNAALGLLNDSPLLVKSAMDYLIYHNARSIPWNEFERFGFFERDE